MPMPTADVDDDDDKELRISVRVPRETYEKIKTAAKNDHRSMAGWVKALIAKALEGETGTVTIAGPSPKPKPRSRKR